MPPPGSSTVTTTPRGSAQPVKCVITGEIAARGGRETLERPDRPAIGESAESRTVVADGILHDGRLRVRRRASAAAVAQTMT